MFVVGDVLQAHDRLSTGSSSFCSYVHPEYFVMQRRWRRTFDESGPVDCVVYRGLGGDSIRIPNCNNLSDMVEQLDELTHWMWGIGYEYEVVLLDSVVVPSDAGGLSAITLHYQLVYTGFRITSMGFACGFCSRFVSWQDAIWFTRYNGFIWHDPNADCKKNRAALYRSREYYCSECGATISGRTILSLEEVICDQESGLYQYKAVFP